MQALAAMQRVYAWLSAWNKETGYPSVSVESLEDTAAMRLRRAIIAMKSDSGIVEDEQVKALHDLFCDAHNISDLSFCPVCDAEMLHDRVKTLESEIGNHRYTADAHEETCPYCARQKMRRDGRNDCGI